MSHQEGGAGVLWVQMTALEILHSIGVLDSAQWQNNILNYGTPWPGGVYHIGCHLQ